MLTKLVSAGLFTGLSAGAYLYAAQWPTSQVFGRTVLAGSDVDEVALTFDDGPNDPYTMQLLELLDRWQVRATFFLMGSFVRQRPEIARAIHQAGHLLGNHTVNHPSLMWARPPFGARRPDVLRTAREVGLTPVMWNVTAYDWEATDPQALAARVRRGLLHNQKRHRGSNVLLHDGGHRQLGTDRSITLSAAGLLLEGWAGSGLRFVTVDAWG
jgi:peptidoglycan/xylan/chitin deacetylase (PgdA/CDA1 family)